MKDSTQYFWFYFGALSLTVALFWLMLRFRPQNEWWSLLFLLPDALAWAGWRVRRAIPRENRFRSSRLLYLDRVMEGLPVVLLLAALFSPLFG